MFQVNSLLDQIHCLVAETSTQRTQITLRWSSFQTLSLSILLIPPSTLASHQLQQLIPWPCNTFSHLWSCPSPLPSDHACPTGRSLKASSPTRDKSTFLQMDPFNAPLSNIIMTMKQQDTQGISKPASSLLQNSGGQALLNMFANTSMGVPSANKTSPISAPLSHLSLPSNLLHHVPSSRSSVT